MEVLKVSWTNTMSECIGIIKARDVMTDEIYVFTGVADGLSEQADTAKILAQGSKMTLKMFLISMLGVDLNV